MKNFFLKVFPWLVTVLALFLAFRGIDWGNLFDHARNGKKGYLLLAVLLTAASYLLRSWRWRHFFPDRRLISVTNAAKVLILGFFMNNILPARAGEVVRAHFGSKVTHTKRTLVLATVASERLADGLVLSAFFIAFALTTANQETSSGLLYVALLFFVATGAVLLTILFRTHIFSLGDRLAKKINHRVGHYALDRLQIFINGLKPLFMPSRFPALAFSSVVIWTVELLAYYVISLAYGEHLSFSQSVIFLVAVNFSSLIPAAPAGIGVIEAVATAILVSVGLNRELALSMVLSQHIIQFLVVGIPGALVMLTWNVKLKEIKDAEEDAG